MAVLSTTQLREAIERVPRFPLAHLPTPLEYLPRLSKLLKGPRIYIKRDDCTGLAMGGNKARHNEFLIADALRLGCDMFVWGAGVQSNNCRQTAAACAKAGLQCHLVLGKGNLSHEAPAEAMQGNLLLDYLLGAKIEFVEEGLGPALDARIQAVAEQYRQRGHKVYTWVRETVTPLAALSYALCLAEILEQARNLGFTVDAIHGSSAGSTGSGLVLGAKAVGFDGVIRHVAPMRWPWDTAAEMAQIATNAGKLAGLEVPVFPSDVDITHDHLGPGYNQVSNECLQALELLARLEGILLDPIYTAKAFAGLIHEIRAGEWTRDQNVVFLHTGGTPVLFARTEELLSRIPAAG